MKLIAAIIFISIVPGSAFANTNKTSEDAKLILTLEQAVKAAQRNDPWLIGNQHSQSAVETMSIAEGTLPDPKMSLGVANIAIDTFDFNQEAMTQFKVGLSQMFPRGNSLELKKKQLQLIGSQYPLQRENRRAKIAVIAAKLWLDAYKAQESIALIENDRVLFEQLADVAEASYSSAVGKTRQQDIVRAQLELTRLDDRLTLLKQKQEMTIQQLSQWLSEYMGESESEYNLNASFNLSSFILTRELPNIGMLQANLINAQDTVLPQELFKYFAQHPAVKALDQKIKASKTGIDLAKQKYKPQWGVSAGYSYRGEAPTRIERADLFSIGVSFDIPLFTENRQDKQVQSATYKSAAVKTEKWLLIRKMIASFETSQAQLFRIIDRQKLYQKRLLPQMHEQAEASLTAYTNDDGDFAEVVRSRIAELNASIDALEINVDKQKTIVELNYFFMTNADEIIINNQSSYRSSGENK
ncbi:MAG: TolC family protein [Maribacter sp.]|nr:TolC family protein [Maribacter sp.]